MPHIIVGDGVPIYYSDQGSGPPIVLLQGLMLTADGFWTRNIDVLSRSNRVIAIDHRSHGQSGKPRGGHSIAQCASDLKDILAALNLEKVTLVGVAFGAMVMLSYLRAFGSTRLEKLVIVEAQVRLTNATDWPHPTFGDFPAEAAQGFLAACQSSREPLAGFLAGAFGTAPQPAEMARMQAQAWLTPTAAAIEFVSDMIAADYRDDLPTISLPTLLVYGRMNNLPIPSELGKWISGQIPDSRYIGLEDAGHSPFYESPQAFNTALAAFANG